MAYAVAINGFGRIGRTAFKIALTRPEIEIVAINDLAAAESLAYLLRYDTAYGKYSEEVAVDQNSLVVGGQSIPLFAEPDPTKLPWRDLNVDVVVESTGAFTKREQAEQHLTAGAKAVVVSAPGKGDNPITIGVLGANELNATTEKLFSNASCTTNCISPIMAILDAELGVAKAMMTTIHAYTASQNIQDGPNKDFRRGRAGAANIIPTTTGAATATTAVLPNLKDKFNGFALRVPLITGSISDITAVVKRQTTVAELNQIFTDKADKGLLKGILQVTTEPIVSSDVIGSSYSAIVDLSFTQVVGGDLVKIVAWYDNEYGYSCRLIDQVIAIAKQVA
ncbi:MAG: type I glyceraldehyde-3-phosphate dehydrogenase [bacterium]|nr:type I glyceraldehyde-3-phosphate dehydrogenase [bacterium]